MDLTERQNTDSILVRSEAEIAAILDSIPMLMLLIDKERRIIEEGI